MHLKHLIFRSLCYFCNSLNFSPHDSIQKLRSAFPNSTLPDTTLYRYLAECKTVKDIDPCIVKHESTPDAIVLSKINETIMQDRFQSPREIASKVGASLNRTISKNTVKKYLHQYLHLESVSCTIIPHELTPEKRRIRVALSKIQSAIQSVWDKTPRVSKIANSGVLSKGVFFSSNRHSLKRRGVWDKTPFQLGGHSGAAGKLTYALKNGM